MFFKYNRFARGIRHQHSFLRKFTSSSSLLSLSSPLSSIERQELTKQEQQFLLKMSSVRKLSLIGNCQVSAVIDDRAAFVFACLPAFDGDPTFCNLLSPQPKSSAAVSSSSSLSSSVSKERWGVDNVQTDGAWLIELEGCTSIVQRYEGDSPVLVSRLDSPTAAIELVDFAPHFALHRGRIFRPSSFVRILRPIRGLPMITVRFRPLTDWGSTRPTVTRGSNHLSVGLISGTVRLATDLPITFIEQVTKYDVMCFNFPFLFPLSLGVVCSILKNKLFFNIKFCCFF